MGSLSECGDGCACAPSCGNRPTQRGVAVRLRVERHLHKGWGLHAAEALGRGLFVCEYAGEFLTTEEAQRRQKLYDELASGGKLSPALIVIREHLPSGKACLRVNIDATNVGNVARFINHSCDGGNLHPVLVRSSGLLLQGSASLLLEISWREKSSPSVMVMLGLGLRVCHAFVEARVVLVCFHQKKLKT